MMQLNIPDAQNQKTQKLQADGSKDHLTPGPLKKPLRKFLSPGVAQAPEEDGIKLHPTILNTQGDAQSMQRQKNLSLFEE